MRYCRKQTLSHHPLSRAVLFLEALRVYLPLELNLPAMKNFFHHMFNSRY